MILSIFQHTTALIRPAASRLPLAAGREPRS
jgi:hypothetical protein